MSILKGSMQGIKKKSGEIESKWIQIRYHSLPKYCKTCKLPGYNEEECFPLHQKLFEESKKEDAKEDNSKKEEGEKSPTQKGRKITVRKRRGKVSNTKGGMSFMKLDKNFSGQGSGDLIEEVLFKDGTLEKGKRGWSLRINSGARRRECRGGGG